MANARLADSVLLAALEAWERHGRSRTAAAHALGLPKPTLQYHLEQAQSRGLAALLPPELKFPPPADIPGRTFFSIDDGHVLIGSDAHYWEGVPSVAHRAFVRFCEDLRPAAVIMNGDILDGATISRHASINWEGRPSLVSEIEACKERMGEITVAAERAARFWPMGNHDSRFETKIANVAPEYAKIHGVHLQDHFPDWEPCWSVWINDNVVVKHRNKGGIHATHNNTLGAGKTIVTGHLHSLKVTPYTDYNGTRFGVDTGTMADPFGPQFSAYMEDNPRNWRSGFAVLTFRGGRLMWPEVVAAVDHQTVEFRGELFTV